MAFCPASGSTRVEAEPSLGGFSLLALGAFDQVQAVQYVSQEELKQLMATAGESATCSYQAGQTAQR
jgi:hypothetical protein